MVSVSRLGLAQSLVTNPRFIVLVDHKKFWLMKCWIEKTKHVCTMIVLKNIIFNVGFKLTSKMSMLVLNYP